MKSAPKVVLLSQKIAPPATPTGLSATTIDSTQVDLAWTDNADDETAYYADWTVNGGAWETAVELAADAESHSITGLSASDVIVARVRAYRSGDGYYSAYSNTDTATTTALPATPTGLTATTIDDGEIDLAWTDNATTETAYLIERSATSESAGFGQIDSIAANSESYQSTGLDPETQYWYRVRAYRSGDTQYSAYSNVDSDTTDAAGFDKASFISTYGLSEVWWLDELTGATATAGVLTPTRDGTYTGVSLNNADGPAGTGMRAGLYDGVEDFCNIYTASLNSIFNGAIGAIFIAGKVAAAGVWTDSAVRRLINIESDADNRIFIGKSATNNTLYAYYIAGGAAITNTISTSTTAWFTTLLSWNKAADEVIIGFNGSKVGDTLTGLGTWAGALSSTYTVIGARQTAAGFPWSGWAQVAGLRFGSVLSLVEYAAMDAVVRGI